MGLHTGILHAVFQSPAKQVASPLHERMRKVRSNGDGSDCEVGQSQKLLVVLGGEGLTAAEDGCKRQDAGARLDLLERLRMCLRWRCGGVWRCVELWRCGGVETPISTPTLTSRPAPFRT